jgi:hypothetical protein
VSAARILVIDGNVAEIRARLRPRSATTRATATRACCAGSIPLQVDIVTAADADPALPPGVGLEHYDGVTMTGIGAQHLRNGGAPVTAPDRTRARRIRRGRAVLRQLLGAAGRGDRGRRRGARQSARPRVRVRAPHLAERRGRAHPLFRRQTDRVRGADDSSRRDQHAPPGAQVLAVNDFGVQAATSRTAAAHSGACSTTRNTTMSISPRPPSATAQRWSSKGCSRRRGAQRPSPPNCASCRRTRTDAPLLWKHGLRAAMRSESLRLLEIRNWLEREVRPRAQRRAT